MRALAVNFSSRRLEVRGLPPPEPDHPEDVVFRVIETGVCGTDRDLASFLFGYPPPGDDFLVLGHEAVGQVVEAGGAVASLGRGDYVVPTVRRRCRPPCATCGRDRPDLCLSGNYRERGIMGLHGYFTEFAADRAEHLIRIPPEILDIAVLAEPLSVVEKAIDRAIAVREEPARTALILGAGPVGLLAAMAFRSRGISPSLHSLEPPGHPRALLAEHAGARYLASIEGRFDIILEATGAVAAAYAGIRALAPLGVCVILGATQGSGDLAFLDLIIGNQAIIGSVNASASSFARAVEDLSRFDGGLLRRLLHRYSFDDYQSSFTATAGETVKRVHVLN
ncbi:MAG: alcohol dehydrogenase catalytic domain-containing protein [Bryobacteraceae bacterium]